MFNRASPPSSSRSDPPTAVDERTLRIFYQKKYQELLLQDDQYKKKVDKHLKSLVTDKRELEEENLRRGDKIADLQKALVELQLSVFNERERFLRVSTENEELKRNEKELHGSIRDLLAMTKQRDLRDKIIYILKNPKVEIGYQEGFSKESDLVRSSSATKQLKEELDHLNHQLDEVLRVSKSKADVLLEDCRHTLETSREKILQDESVIQELQRRLQRLEDQARVKRSTSVSDSIPVASQTSQSRMQRLQDQAEDRRTTSVSDGVPVASQTSRYRMQRLEDQAEDRRTTSVSDGIPVASQTSQSRMQRLQDQAEDRRTTSVSDGVPVASQTSRYRMQRLEDQAEDRRTTSVSDGIPVASQTIRSSRDEEVEAKICCDLKEVHLALILLTKMVSKVMDHLNAMQATKLYQRIADIPSVPYDLEHVVADSTILQLEDCLRQCTRLAFDISNKEKSLQKYISDNQRRVQNINSIKSELKVLEGFLREMSIMTADNDLLNVGLRRSSFFDALRDSSTVIGAEDKEHLVNDFKKIVNTSEVLKKTVSQASGFVEDVLKKYSVEKHNVTSRTRPSVSAPLLHSQSKDSGQRLTAKSDTEVMSQRAKHNSRKDLENLLGIYRRTAKEAESLGLSSDLLSEKIKATEKKLQEQGIQTSAEKRLQEQGIQAFPDRKLQEQGIQTSAEKRLQEQGIQAFLDRKLQEQGIQTTAEKRLQEQGIQTTTERKLQEQWNQTSAELNQGSRMSESKTSFDMSEESRVSGLRSRSEEVLRSINKTLSKVDLIQQDRYLKDEEVCRKLADNVNALREQFKHLTEDINVRSVQEQFSEYSNLTLSKLEELAKQSRNSVIAAEAQIAAHRSNAKHLSEKLNDTEELLRESINECLSLKQRLTQVEDQRDMEKYSMLSSLKEKLKECGTSTQVDQLLDEMAVDVSVQTTTKPKSSERFVCMYCKQGSEHKLCEEKIRDLTAEVRKYRTQMKLREREIHEEKLSLKTSQSAAENTVGDLTEKNRALNVTVEELKRRNASILEQLTVQKNRIKNMERFRRLEIEGFQTDMKQLKNKIKDLEKQLMKAVVIFETNKKDMELLHTVHETAQRSKQATAALRRLKAKLYELENDIKSL